MWRILLDSQLIQARSRFSMSNTYSTIWLMSIYTLVYHIFHNSNMAQIASQLVYLYIYIWYSVYIYIYICIYNTYIYIYMRIYIYYKYIYIYNIQYICSKLLKYVIIRYYKLHHCPPNDSYSICRVPPSDRPETASAAGSTRRDLEAPTVETCWFHASSQTIKQNEKNVET